MHRLVDPARLSRSGSARALVLALVASMLTLAPASPAASVVAAPALSVALSDDGDTLGTSGAPEPVELVADMDGDGNVDPGDVIRYTLSIMAGGASPVTAVSYTDTVDANTAVVAGSLSTTPIARDDTYTSIGNVGITVPGANGVLANDDDADGDTLAVTPAAGATTSGGAFSVGADGGFSYSPPAGFEGSDSFTYEVTDADAHTDEATVSITVSGSE